MVDIIISKILWRVAVTVGTEKTITGMEEVGCV